MKVFNVNLKLYSKQTRKKLKIKKKIEIRN